MKTVNTVRFGSGRLVVTDATGPMPVAELTDVTVDFGATDKELESGDNQMAVFSVRTNQKATVKAKIQRALSTRLMAALNGGTVSSTQAKQAVDREQHSAAASVAAIGSNVVLDLGVLDTNANPMTPVASAPQIGEYSVSIAAGTATYTFNASQTGNVYLSYIKTVTTGEWVDVNQQNIAQSPTIQGYFYSKANQPDGTVSNRLFVFAALVPSKLSEAAKRGDFANADVEFNALATAAGDYYEVHNT